MQHANSFCKFFNVSKLTWASARNVRPRVMQIGGTTTFLYFDLETILQLQFLYNMNYNKVTSEKPDGNRNRSVKRNTK